MIKMIILEDEPWIRKGIEKMLPWSEMGIEYSGFASNGKKGLELIEQFRPEIIITDIKMPVMNGITFLETLREKGFSGQKVIFLTGYNDFNYTKKAIQYGAVDYILKPVDPRELKDTVLKLIRNIKQESQTSLKYIKMQIFNYLYGQTMNPTDISYGELILPYPYFSMLISTHPIPKSVNIEKYLSEYFSFQFGNTIIYILCSSDETFSTEMIQEQLSLLLRGNYSFGLSKNYFSNREHIIKAFQEAQNNLLSGFKHNLKHSHSSPGSYFTKKHEQEMLSLLQTGNKLKSLELIYELLETTLFFEEKWIIVFQVYTFLSRYLNRPNQYQNGDGIIFQLKMANSSEDLKEITKNFIFPLIDHIVTEWNQSPSEIGIRARRYIDDHYMDPLLSLTMVADILKISPSYLSHIFKEELKVNFTQYVAEKRISKAKENLLNSHMPVYLISEKTGFNDPKYFNRVFKKQTGLTPKQFREIHII